MGHPFDSPLFPIDTEPVLGDGPARRWTYDRRTNVVMGVCFRREADYPCAAPFPCGDHNFDPRRMEPITMHPVRDFDRVSLPTPETSYKEAARYLFGFFFMRPDGLIGVAVAVRPHRYRTFAKPEWVVCTGGLFVAQAGESSGLLRPGRMYLIVSVPTPPWIAAMFDSEREDCCPES